MLNDLTIIIPTINRSKNLDTQIEHIKNWGSQIYVLDGTDQKDVNIEKLSKKYLNLKYIHDTSGYHKRLMRIKDQIKTKYAMLMADDEFFIKKSLEMCVEFLNNNSDYVSCSGIAIAFNKSKKNKVIYKEIYPKLIGYNISDFSPKDRVINHLSNYVASSYYGVLHTKVIDKYIEEIKYSNTSCSETPEIWLQSSTAYLGKIMVLPVLYWFRSMVNSPVEDKKDKYWNRSIKFFQWYTKKKFKREKMKFIKDFCKLNNENSSSFFELALNNYSKILMHKGHGSIIRIINLFFNRVINLFLRIIKLNKILAKRREAYYFDFVSLKNFLIKRSISFDIESIRDVEKKII